MVKKIAVVVLGMFLFSLMPGFALAGSDDGLAEEAITGMKGKIKHAYGANKGQIKKGNIRKIKPLKQEFADIENDWAREEIAEATVKGFVYGYEDFTFRPNKPVTCLETITLLIRAAGLDEQVNDYELSAEQETLLKKIPEWGRPYIAVALEQGILTGDVIKTFNPWQGAKRYEVCQYMYRSLNAVEGENLAGLSGDDSEEFIDEEQIPSGVRQHVRLMKLLGIINGYPNGSFSPMRVVKRNEITVMLNRMDQNCLQVFDSNIIEGELQLIEAVEGGFEITVKDSNGEQVKVKTNEQTRLFFRGKLYDINADIGEGCIFRILTNEDGEAVLIRIIPGEEDQEADVDQD